MLLYMAGHLTPSYALAREPQVLRLHDGMKGRGAKVSGGSALPRTFSGQARVWRPVRVWRGHASVARPYTPGMRSGAGLLQKHATGSAWYR